MIAVFQSSFLAIRVQSYIFWEIAGNKNIEKKSIGSKVLLKMKECGCRYQFWVVEGESVRFSQFYTYIQIMKKLQSYLMKPQELRKKLQNPRFRQDFIEWSKSNISLNKQAQSRQSRSKSPVESNQRSLHLQPKKAPFNNKENIRLQSGQKSPLPTKTAPKTPLSSKGVNQQKTVGTVKRNTSNSLLARGPSEKESSRNYQSLNSKTRYNSCSTITAQKRQRSSSHHTSALAIDPPQRRIRQRYSYRTRQGVQANNPHKVNQDSLLIKTNLAERDTNLYAIADGHGAQGHLVSQFLVKNISRIFQNQLKNNNNLPECIPKVYQKLQKGLSAADFNASCSGSTLVGVAIDGDEVICANVGDSRAILARQIDRKSWELIYLSQDHKPSVEVEKKRILKAGGRVHAFRDQNGMPVGPLRVWLPNQNLQGLAMSRSFGDNVSKGVGVTAEPQIIRIRVDKRDKFILLASDGVWQFISNQQVLQLIVPYYKQGKLEQACNALAKLAYERWTVQDSSVVDDITFILIFLEE